LGILLVTRSVSCLIHGVWYLPLMSAWSSRNPLLFRSGVVRSCPCRRVHRMLPQCQAGDPEQMKAELRNFEILLHNKVLKGGKAFKPTNKTTDDCLKFLQDIAPDDDSINQKMPAQKKAKTDNTNATAV
jgi:hypothetical protein